MKKHMNNRGMVLFTLIGFMTVLAIGATAITSFTGQQARNEHRLIDETQALYLAEAAISRGELDLTTNFSGEPTANEGFVYQLGDGEYYFQIDDTADPDEKLVTGYGAMPNFDTPKQVRAIQTTVSSVTSSIDINFDYTIFGQDDIDINGSKNVVDGDILAGDEINCSPSSCPGVSGDKTEMNDEDFPFPMMDMDMIKAAAIAQGHYYATAPDPDDLPTSFYYTAPTGPSDPGVPNIIYIEDQFSINGGDEIGGLIIIAGDYATNPDDTQGDFAINGNAEVNGVIYALGDVVLNGGGNSNPTVDGVIYADGSVTLHGKPAVLNNEDYLDSISAAEFDTGEIEPSGWNEITVPDAIANPE